MATTSRYGLFQEELRPSGADLCVRASFVSAQALNLIVARADSLEIFTLASSDSAIPASIPDSNSGVSDSDLKLSDGAANDASSATPRERERERPLRLHSIHRLHGRVIGLKALRLPGCARDAILLAFATARLSVVAFDGVRNTLEVLSLHCWERSEAALGEGRFQPASAPILEVDPDARAAAMLVYGHHLAVVPLSIGQHAATPGAGPAVMVADPAATAGSTAAPTSTTAAGSAALESALYAAAAHSRLTSVQPSYLLDLKALDIVHVIDVVFMHGYYTPTIVVLYQPRYTWAGNIELSMDTCSLCAISLNVSLQQQTVIWTVEKLPFNCDRLAAVPAPLGGVLVFSANILMYISQTVKQALPLNAVAYRSSSVAGLPFVDYRPPPGAYGITLDAARFAFLNGNLLLVCMQSGGICFLHLESDDGRTLAKLALERVSVSVQASCMATVSSSLVFIGSRLGDSLLVRCRPRDEAEALERDLRGVALSQQAQDGYGGVGGSRKRTRTSQQTTTSAWESLSSDAYEETEAEAALEEEERDHAEDDEFADLYGNGGSSGAAGRRGGAPRVRYRLELADTIRQVGPLRSLALAPAAATIRRRAVRALWDEPRACGSPIPALPRARYPRLELLAGSGAGKDGHLTTLSPFVCPTTLMQQALPGCVGLWGLRASVAEHHAYLVLSLRSRTLVLETGEELQEVSDQVELCVDRPTVLVTMVNVCRRDGHSLIVQVLHDQVLLLSNVETLLCRFSLESETPPPTDGRRVLLASCAGRYLLLLLCTGQVLLLRVCGGDDDTADDENSESSERMNEESDHTTAANEKGLDGGADGGAHRVTMKNQTGAAGQRTRVHDPFFASAGDEPSLIEYTLQPVPISLLPTEELEALGTSFCAPAVRSVGLYRHTRARDRPSLVFRSREQMRTQTLYQSVSADTADEAGSEANAQQQQQQTDVVGVPVLEESDFTAEELSLYGGTLEPSRPRAPLPSEAEVEALLRRYDTRERLHGGEAHDADVDMLMEPRSSRSLKSVNADVAKDGGVEHPDEADAAAADETLYGSLLTSSEKSASAVLEAKEAEELKELQSNLMGVPVADKDAEADEELVEQFFAVLAFAEGTVCVYELPSFRLVFRARALQHSPVHLWNDETPGFAAVNGTALSPKEPLSESETVLERELKPHLTGVHEQAQHYIAASKEVWVMEVFLTNLGPTTSDELPFLLVRLSNGELLCYQSYITQPPIEVTQSDHPLAGHFCFNKVSNTFSATPLSEPESTLPAQHMIPWTTSLERGVFVCGENASFVFCPRGLPFVMPLGGNKCGDGGAMHFAAFHNVNCPNGFAYIWEDSLRIAHLNSAENFETGWSLRKVLLRQALLQETDDAIHAKRPTTLHKLVYLPFHEIYVGSISQTYAIQSPPEASAPGFRPVRLTKENFDLRLLGPDAIETYDVFPLEENEHVLDMEYVQLKVITHVENKKAVLEDELPVVWKPFLVVGTAYQLGEDQLVTGRILLFQVIVQEESAGQAKPKLKLLMEEVCKGAISSVGSVEGLLSVAVGPKLLFYQYDETKKIIVGKAFFDCQTYIVTIRTIQNYIVVADLFQSVYLLHWRSGSKTLVLIGKDFEKVHTSTCEVLLSGGQFSIMLADEHMNMQMLVFDPKAMASRGGRRLLPVADFHLGFQTSASMRLRTRTRQKGYPVHASLFGSTDGAVASLIPLDERSYRRLAMLNYKLITSIPHAAGLNPQAYRMFKRPYNVLRECHGNVLDGRLLQNFIQLDARRRRELSAQIGLKVEDVLETIRKFDLTAPLFSALREEDVQYYKSKQPIDEVEAAAKEQAVGAKGRSSSVMDEEAPVVMAVVADASRGMSDIETIPIRQPIIGISIHGMILIATQAGG
eukprot:CAMPEP_0174241462 /NCGR_PEP_ID=MMETSP0417-20130205/23505_1 /TAXON_ID=242541 /ORGANISM="Mayorella sp, Strain BSH-02190019" /LENGTH=1875 /DNA_ID=CAMNT_0015320703 /DNA_START=121 /DNA_END=5746 /DNA_ORIENTATION=+